MTEALSPAERLSMSEIVPVEQCDREAAALAREWEYSALGYSVKTLETPTEMRNGHRDFDPLVQSYAKHRLTALSQSARPVVSEWEVIAALDERNEYLAQLGGCGDGHCIVVKPKGMHTNGGCRCWLDGFKMQRYAYANNKFADAIATLQHKEADHG